MDPNVGFVLIKLLVVIAIGIKFAAKWKRK